jgi:hypothetical protein
VFDAAPSKQGKFLPGSHLPIAPADRLADSAPDAVLILPWNIAEEVIQWTRDRVGENAQYVTAVPSLKKQAAHA